MSDNPVKGGSGPRRPITNLHAPGPIMSLGLISILSVASDKTHFRFRTRPRYYRTRPIINRLLAQKPRHYWSRPIKIVARPSARIRYYRTHPIMSWFWPAGRSYRTLPVLVLSDGLRATNVIGRSRPDFVIGRDIRRPPPLSDVVHYRTSRMSLRRILSDVLNLLLRIQYKR